MSNDVLALAIISGMTVFFIIMLTAAAFYNSRQEKGNVLTGQSGGDDWLFKGFSETMYDAVIKRPKKTAASYIKKLTRKRRLL